MEQEEWNVVNRELRQHSFALVELTDPCQSTADISDLVVLSAECSKSLRHTLVTLMKDCDRRQELVQELIITNNQLRHELKTQTGVTEKYETKTRDLQYMLDDSRLKLQGFEDDQLNLSMVSHDETERLRNTKQAATTRCEQLDRKCQLYQQEIDRLQKKLKRINHEEEGRKKKQMEVLKQMRQKWAKGSATNESILNVIDYYEAQVTSLKQDLDLAQSGITTDGSHDNTSRTTNNAINSDTTTGNYKALIKSYERQLRDTKKKMKTLENESELMKLELQSRPELKDLREAQTRLKKLERTLKKHGICPAHDSEKKSKMLFSTKAEDLEFLPVSHCRQYLKTVCVLLHLDDAEEISDRIEQLTTDSEALPQLQLFNQSVVNVVNSNGNHRSTAPHAGWCEKNTHHVLPTLEHWALQIQANQELQQSIHRLATSMLPWKQLHHADNPTTMELIEQIDSLGEESDETQDRRASPPRTNKQQARKDVPSQTMLQEIVSHIQTLFDIDKVTGVYARINDVYTRLGEAQNVMKTLNDLLGLDPGKTSAIVDVVARLTDSRYTVTAEHIRSVLHTDDLDSVALRLAEHDEFFPVFHELLQKLIEALNVHRLDQVLPAVRALKLLAGS